MCVEGWLFKHKRKHLVLLLSILVHFRWMRMAFKARKLLLQNDETQYFYFTFLLNPRPPTWWYWYRFTEDIAVAGSQLFSLKKSFWKNHLLTLYIHLGFYSLGLSQSCLWPRRKTHGCLTVLACCTRSLNMFFFSFPKDSSSNYIRQLETKVKLLEDDNKLLSQVRLLLPNSY